MYYHQVEIVINPYNSLFSSSHCNILSLAYPDDLSPGNPHQVSSWLCHWAPMVPSSSWRSGCRGGAVPPCHPPLGSSQPETKALRRHQVVQTMGFTTQVEVFNTFTFFNHSLSLAIKTWLKPWLVSNTKKDSSTKDRDVVKRGVGFTIDGEIGQEIIGNGQPLWYLNIAMEKTLNRLIEDLISSNFHITSVTNYIS